jgi:hypothetical protein
MTREQVVRRLETKRERIYWKRKIQAIINDFFFPPRNPLAPRGVVFPTPDDGRTPPASSLM